MTKYTMATIPVKETDYLEQDPALRGQNFVCLSFISPDEVIKKKDVFMFEQFLKHFSADMNEFFDKLSEKYKDEIDVVRSIREKHSAVFNPKKLVEEYGWFIAQNSNGLESDYYKENNFQTTIRGIKVRGTFDTLREAEVRAQVLKKVDPHFNVYVAQVGCWCPWSPNPEDIENQEYAETHLNTLMHNYKQNQSQKDAFYEERKRDMQAIKKPAPAPAVITEEPPVEATKEEPSVEATKEEPSVEATTEEPSVEATKEEPPVEATKGEPPVEATTEEPSVEAPTKALVEPEGGESASKLLEAMQ